MKNLIYKELSLVIPKGIFLFCILAGVALIPSYPYIAASVYFVFGIQILFEVASTNRDLEFTSMLPIPRNAIVVARSISVGIIQLAQWISIIPFALISSLVLNKGGNIVGIDANFAYFGLILIYYSAFNLTFLPKFFKTGFKLASPIIWAIAVFSVCVIIGEFSIAFVPTLNRLFDGLTSSGRLFRIFVLFVGIATYVLSMWLSIKKAIKNFEKVNL